MISIFSEPTTTPSTQFARARESVRQLISRQDLGFLQLPRRTNLWDEAIARAKRVQAKNLAILGIGGSSLGGISIQESLGISNLHFFENIDAKDFWDRLKTMPISETHWVVISKSGRTIETLTQVNFIHEYLKSKNIKMEDQTTVISEVKSNPLSDWARSRRIPLLEISADVGGRFSVLSPVGMFPAAFSGVNISEFREGALWMLDHPQIAEKMLAHILQSFAEEKWITVFWAYSNRLRSFGLWIEQLWAESLGKSVDRDAKPAPRASTPISLIGANDQHSVLQQISEGAKDKFVVFLRVKESENFGPILTTNLFEDEGLLVGKNMGALLAAEANATQKSLRDQGVPSLGLEIESLDAKTLGALFMFFEIVVGSIGEAHNINAFDQPGVELGKRLAKENLSK